MSRLRFSGHESFLCKHFWPHKGFDFVRNGGKFSSKTAVVDLGVGKNMVSSIRFWLKSLNLIDEEDELQPFARYIFGDGGRDPYIEQIGTVWLLHSSLVKRQYASIYNLVFNSFQIGRTQFSYDSLFRYLKRECETQGIKTSEKSLSKDIDVFLRNYIRPQVNSKSNIEDDFTRLFIELDLIQSHVSKDSEGQMTTWFSIPKDEKPELPWQIVLYSIMEMMEKEQPSITFDQISKSQNSPGLIFSLNNNGLLEKIDEMTRAFPKKVNYSETRGNRVLQINSNLSKIEVLDGYYKN